MNDVKFFIGPMTQNIIDSVIEFSEENNVKLGFCATRRQIEYNGGYVGFKTDEFVKYVNSKTDKVIIERDHAGLGQGTILNSHIRTSKSDMRSLLYDANNGINIIHIDPWKKHLNYDLGLRETINNILSVNKINSNILFEVGTEEAIRRFETIEFLKLLMDLKIELGDIFTKNVKYAVIQSGTKLLMTKNIGKFNLQRLNEMILICKEFKILSKEHNGDYLSNEEIKIRFNNGLNAINIAPEFGVFETNIILNNYVKSQKHLNQIWEICLNGERWKKWVDDTFDYKNKKKLIEICGHYHNKEIKKIANVDDDQIKVELKNKLKHLILF